MLKISCLICLSAGLAFQVFGQKTYEQSMEDCERLGLYESYQCFQGSAIPEFEGTTVEGMEMNNDAIKGKVAVLHFWFMSCPPCMAELDGLNKVVEQYKDRNDVVFLSFTLESLADLKKYFFPQYSMTFKIIPDAQFLIFNVFRIRWGFPTTMVINKAGQIQFITSGGNTDPVVASENIKETLMKVLKDCLEK